MTRRLPGIWYYNSVLNSPNTDMLIIWNWYVYSWHLIPDTWYLTSVLDMLSLNTWCLTPNIWHLIIDMLSFGTIHLTWYCDTWLDTITPDTCITLLIYDYRFYGDLTWLLYCYQTSDTPELLYSWTPVLLNSCILEPLEQGDSWCYSTDTILLLISVIN